MADFRQAFNRTSANEGGYAHVPGDTGGETYAGISRKWFPDWAGWTIVDKYKPLRNNQIIRNPTLQELVADFYKVTFWDAVGGDSLDDQPTAERLYDFGVNAGKSVSIKQIQEILGIAQTGKIDDDTIDAINNPAKYLS